MTLGAILRAITAFFSAIFRAIFPPERLPEPEPPPEGIGGATEAPAPITPPPPVVNPVARKPPRHWHSVVDYIDDMLRRWEGGYQAHRNDRGNWVGGYKTGTLVGTNRGITPATLATFLGVPVTSLTPEDMRAITHAEAALIAHRLYYVAPGFSRLTWCPAVEVLVDYGWGSGTDKSVKALQRILGVTPDGQIGPVTTAAFERWIDATPPAYAVQAISDARWAHWDRISRPGLDNHIFRAGWRRRADWYRPNNLAWWKL